MWTPSKTAIIVHELKNKISGQNIILRPKAVAAVYYNAKLLPVSSIKLILNCQHTSLPKTIKRHINGPFIQRMFGVKWVSLGYIFEGYRLVTVTVNLKRSVELLRNCLMPQRR